MTLNTFDNRNRPSQHGLVLGVVCVALAAVVAAMASLNLALPSIARGLHASQTDLLWIIDAYSLAFAALLLPGGAIGDRYGRRVALVIGLVIFGGGSAVAMTAGSASELIALRAILGLGAALVMPATLSTITSTFPPDKRPRAVSIWAAVAGGAAVVGLLGAGMLLINFSWRSVFGLNVLLSGLALVGTLRFVPESADPQAPKMDLTGAAIAVATLVSLVYSVIEAPSYGWLATRTIVGLTLSFVLLATFVVWELHQSHPLLDPRVFRKRPLAAGSTSIFVQFFAFYGYTFIGLQYLQLARGDTPARAAVEVLPLAAALMPASRLSARFTAQHGPRKVGTNGLTLIASGLTIVAQVNTHSPYWIMAAGLIVLGLGLGTATTPATSSITETLPPAQQGVGSALNDLSREVGGAIGIAVIGSILTSTYTSQVNVTGLPSRLATQVRHSYAVASQLPSPISDNAHAAFVTGMHTALLTAAATSLVAAVGAVMLAVRRTRRSPGREPQETTAATTPTTSYSSISSVRSV
jgi:EmrB/QacA subfamily drug resistance transporter